MSELRHMAAGVWTRYLRPGITPETPPPPVGGSGFGNNPFGTSAFGD